jgi:hypothetical protein
VGRSVPFDVSEYTLAFRRILGRKAGCNETTGRWVILRPVLDIPARGAQAPASDPTRDGEVAQVFIVPVCSTLALDDRSYERFLRQSGVLDDALELLSSVTFAEADSVDTIRKEIHSLIMAAEVKYIVDGMSA